MSKEHLFDQIYVSNLKNRLKELNNPTEEDIIRWPIELIQNAKDSIYQISTEKKQVSITIEIKGSLDNVTEVVFSHDGPHFTQDSYNGLMFKISEGKDDKKTTGKFGTGFLTTHVLSKTVFISGDIEKDNKISGFTSVMYREGETKEEILNNFNKMSESLEVKSNRFNRTTFTYQTSTIQSKKCAKLGIENLKDHIPYILINCPEIKCIKLIENGNEVKYSASKSDENPIHYNITTFNQINEEKRRFLKFESKPVDIIIEIDNEYNIMPKKENVECIYASLPLIGTGFQVLPFSINSKEFEPSTERNILPLSGEGVDVENNKNLILCSIDLYKKLITELKNNNCSNMQILARGLKINKYPNKSFDLDWYKERYIQPMRDILANEITVKSCSNREILLSNTYFPDDIKSDAIEKFLSLSAIKKYYPNMIEYNDFILWKDYIWETTRNVSLNNLIEKVSNDESLFDEPQLKTFNKILSFIWEYDKNLLHDHALIPNMQNELKYFSFDGVYIKECKKVSDDIIQIIEEIKITWKSTHVNNMINSIQFDEDDEIDAEKKIINEFKFLIDNQNKEELQKFSYSLMKFVLENDEKREKMFHIASLLDDFPYKNTDIISVSKVNPIVWKLADDFVLKKVIDDIQRYDSSNIKNRLDYIKEFISVFKMNFKLEPEFINSAKIIPNANNELKCLNDLINPSTELHNHFSPKIKEFFGIDLDDRIINPEINQIIQSEKNEIITDFLSIIDNNINVDDFEKYLPIAELVLSVIPSKNLQQIEIFNNYQRFKPSIEKILINDNSFNLEFYDKTNKIILSKSCQYVEEAGSLHNLQEYYSLSEDEAFDSLNLLYNKFEEGASNHAIIPNKEGKFMAKKDLRIDPNIDEKLFELFTKLSKNSEIPEDQQLNSPQKIVHPRVKLNGIELFDVMNFCMEINKKINGIISNPYVDHEIFKLISDCFKIDLTNAKGESISNDQKVRKNILHNYYIKCIQNKINDFKKLKDSDSQRWPFELIQNATDCIQDSTEKIYNEKKNGHIVFIFNNDEVIFKHYGAPFTQSNLISLLYQYSGKKEEKPTIGKFGTGFLSTMILTRKVIITGDLQNEDGSIKGFTVTIDRSGVTDDELENNIKSMEDSLDTELEKTGKTKFVFKLPEKNEGNKICYKAYDDGLESLVKNIAPSLIFNPKIKSITVKVKAKTEKDEDTFHVYTLEDDDGKEEEEEEEIKNKPIIKQIKNEDKINNEFIMPRQFIYHSSQKTYNDKNIKVECLLEIGSENKNIISNEEFLFLQFPLFGNKEFKSPIIINSPDFETETERNDIIINSKQLNDSLVITDSSEEIDDIDDNFTSINKFIILEVVKIFKSIIKTVREIRCVNLFNICYGLKDDSKNQFYQQNFIEIMRNIILKSKVFEYSPRTYTKYESVIIPYIKFDDFSSDEEDVKNETPNKLYEIFYSLVSHLKYEKKVLMKYPLCLKWIPLLWNDFENKFDIHHFLSYVSQYEDVDKLPFNKNGSISKEELFAKKELFFCKLILFINKMKKRDSSLSYKNNKIFLNKNKKLVLFEEIVEFNWNDEAKDVIFNWMNIVDYNYKNKMLSDGLGKLYKKIVFDEFPIESGIHDIEDRINEDNSIYFMKYVIKDDNKRELMYKFSKKLLFDSPYEKVEIDMSIFESKNPSCNMDNIINCMFKKADDFIIDKLIAKIQDIDVKENIDFLLDFVKLCKESMPSTKLEKYKIVPNKNFKLCNYRELSKDCIENESLKKILNETLKLDLNEELVHDKFNDFVDNKMNLNDASSKILDCISKQGKDFYKVDKIELFKIILQQSIGEDINFAILLNIFKFFYKIEDIAFSTENTQYFAFNLTKKIIELIFNDIAKCISLFNNIHEFAYQFDKCSTIYEIFSIDDPIKENSETNLDLIYNNLSDVYYLLLKYNLLKSKEYKVFPNNYNGDLLYFEDIIVLYDIKIDNCFLFGLLDHLIQLTISNVQKNISSENQENISSGNQENISSKYQKNISSEYQKNILNKQIPVKKDFGEIFKSFNLSTFVTKIENVFPKSTEQQSELSKEQNEFFDFIGKNETLRSAFANLINSYVSPNIISNLREMNKFSEDNDCIKFAKEFCRIGTTHPIQQQLNHKQQHSNRNQPQISRPNSANSRQPTSISRQAIITQRQPTTFPRQTAPMQSTPNPDIDQFRKQAELYEILINNPQYSNVNWPIKSESKTSYSFNYKDKTYFIDLNCDRSDDYDISACHQGQIVYFKVMHYFPYFMKDRNHQKDGKNIVCTYVDHYNGEAIYINNINK